ncbi:MAG TPA: DNA helicase, partial [Anaerolineae bacterium]|nr:DNA helicase [Anaerolineae bacterium]
MVTIYYARVGEDWRKEAKYDFLTEKQHIGEVEWQTLQPDARYTWLTEGLSAEFETFLPMGTKEGKAAEKGEAETIFKVYSRGVCSNGDTYVYNFNCATLSAVAQGMVDNYNAERYRWMGQGRPQNLDEFLRVDETKLKWIRRTKRSLLRGLEVEFDTTKIRWALYRPFCRQFHYFETVFNEDIYRFPQIFPILETENSVICITDKASEKPFMVLTSDSIPDLHLVGAGANAQCFPFYTYAEDGSARRENITDWALTQFRAHYLTPSPPHQMGHLP